MKKIFNILLASIVIATVGMSIVSCEDDSIGLGSGLVGGDVEGNFTSYDVIAYNTYADSIRSDQKVLQNALLGAYEESVFGRTKASFISQLRLSTTSPSFGTNAQVDSVNLIIPIYTVSSSDSVVVDTINLSKPGVKAEVNDTILIRKTYKVDSIYGNKNATMNLKVRDINTVLYTDQVYYSKSSSGADDYIDVNSTVLGSARIGNKVQNITIKEKGSDLDIYSESVGYKITLDKNYFQQKIINNQNTGLLSDYATFLREVIKGIHISVEENDGFLFAFNPNKLELKMHYSSDNTTDNTRKSSSLSFDLTSFWASTQGSNVQVSHLDHSNKGAAFLNNLSDAYKTSGSPRLFLNGADGTKINVKFPDSQINQLKSDFESNNWTIIGAKLKFFIDEAYNYPKPGFITAWNEYTDAGNRVNALYADVTNYYNAYPDIVHFNPFIGDKNYYTIDITLHIKDIIEKGEIFLDQEMVVAMGNFLMSSSDASTLYSTNPLYRNTVANPYRVVLHGNASENADKKLKLLVYYTNK